MAVTEPGSEVGEPLNERQLSALQKLKDLGAEPRPSADAPYSSTPQIRAYQMIYEGKIAGPGRGQGRKRQKRASEVLAERLVKKVDRMERAIVNALDSDSDKVALQAVQLALKIEHDEAALKLQEERLDHDLDNASKEDLVAELLSLAGDPGIEGIIDIPESAVQDITDAEVIEEEPDPRLAGTSQTWRDNFAPRSIDEVGAQLKGDRRNGRRSGKGDRQKTPSPFTKAARRRAAD